MSTPVRIGITQGDINGVGLELILKTFQDQRILELCTPIVFSSQKTISYHKKALDIQEFNYAPLNSLNEIKPGKINLFNCYEEEVNIELGKPTALGGTYALKSIEAACLALSKNHVDALVTAPINKHSIQSKEFSFPGHTEFLEKRFGNGGEALMLMVAEEIKVAVVTGHIPVSKISASLSSEKIVRKLETLSSCLLQDFLVKKPRIAVLGLNPHAGDSGTLGNEELAIIKPAIEAANKDGVLAFGPYGADGFFGARQFKHFDAVLAMYHDQGLIPFKALAFEDGVNFTAGLPIIRTSPDHGTAYDIVGKNKVSETSFRNAIYTALDIFKNRSTSKEITQSALPIQEKKQGKKEG